MCRRSLLLPFLMLALPLGALAAVGATVAHRQLSETRELAAARTLDAVRVVVADFQGALRREALLLSRDPGVVEGATRGDWATLARGASPRLLSLTRDGVAEFIVVRDRRGAPLVQVPALPPTSAPGILAGNEPMVELKVIAERAYFLATAPVVTGTLADILQDGGSKVVVGTVVVGRRLESLASMLEHLPSRPALIVLSADRALGSTRPEIPPSGWTRAVAAGGVDLGGERFRLRRIEVGAEARAADAALWVLLPDAEFARAERRVRLEFAALLAAGLLVIAGGVLLVGQGRRGPPPDRTLARREAAARDPRTALERRQRENEALSAIAAAIGRGADLAATAAEMLDTVCRLAGMDVGAVYRLDPEGGRLVLVAQRGLSAEEAESARALPVDSSRVGEAVRSGRIQVTPPDAAPPLGPGLQELAVQQTHRTRLALPIAVEGRSWGAMALGSREVREFRAEELAALEAVAQQVGLAVGRVELQEMAAARLSRLEAQRLIERHISDQLDVEELLVMIAESALRLIGGAFSVLYLREEEVLRARAWCDVGDWIRDIPIPPGSGATGAALERGRGVLVNDYANSPFALPAFSGAVGRILVQPLLAGGRALGAMTICRDAQASPFTEDDLSTLADFAAKAAVALEQARLFAAASRSAAQYQALFEVGGLMGSTLEVQGVLDVIVERCCALLAVRGAGIFRLEAGTGHLVYERGRGLSPEFVTALRVRAGEGTTGRAVQDRKAAWSTDLLADAGITLSNETRALVQREGYRAVLSVPLLSKGEAHGALAVYWWEPHMPTPAEISLLHALAGQAAVALENARLYEAATRRGKRLSTLTRLTQTLTATLSLEELLSRVVHSAVELFGSSFSTLWLADEGGETFSLRAQAGSRSPMVGAIPFRPGEGPVGRIVADRLPLVIADLREDPRARSAESAPAEGGISFAGVPLLLGERVLGALSITLREPRGFSDEDLSLLESLANHAAIAIENARLYEALDVRAARLRTLSRLAHLVSSSLDMDEVLRAISRAAAEFAGAPLAAFWVADEAARTLALRAFSDDRMATDYPLAVIDFDRGVTGWVAAQRRPLDVPDVSAEPRYVASEWAERHGITSFLGIPIMFQDSLLGVLALNGRSPFHLDAEDMQLLDSFVAQAGVAIRNARLYAETSRRLEETRALLKVAEILSSTLEPRRMLKQAAIEIARVCRVDRCSVERWDGDHVVPLMSQFADGRKQPDMWSAFVNMTAYLPRDIPIHAQAIHTRRPVVIPDAGATDLIPREWVEAFGLKSYMVVPLIRQDEVIGVMTLDHNERVTPFEPWQLDLAMAIGGQLALSLENARLYAEAQERLRETTTLLAVGRALSQPGPPEEMMRQVARETARAFGADMVGVYVLDERQEALVPLAGYHVPKHLLELFMTRKFALARFPALEQVWRARRAVWSSDVTHDPRFDQQTFEGIRAHSVLFAPTPVRGEPVGALFLVWWGAGREFDPAEIRLIEGVAAQMGLAMENAELARRTQRKLQETETLLSVSQTLSSTLDMEMLPRQFLRHVVQALGADTAGIWLLSEDGEWMDPFVGYHVPPDRLETLRRLRLSIVRHPFYAEAARTRQSVVCHDVMNDPRMPDEVRQAVPVRTHLFVPIIAKDRMVGGFAAGWWESRRELSDAELRLMEAIASQAGVALENARLFRDNRRRVEELSVLHELSRAVTGQLDQAGLIDTLRQQVARVLDVRHMIVLLLDETGDCLRVALRVRDGVRRDEEPRAYPRHAAGLSGAVLATGQSIRTEDYLGECARRGVESIPESAGLPHWLGVPMAAGNQVLGVLALRGRDRAFSDIDERLLTNIAQLAALALRSARLYEERTRAFGELAAAQDQLVRTEKLRALGEMASGVAHDFNNVLASILGRAQLLRDRVQDPKHRQWLEVIERSALDGARTVRRLQDFTRIRRDQPVVAVDLNQIIHQVLETTESTWRQETRRRGGEIEVVTALAPGLPRVAGDPAELREAFTNLVLNAVDAMPGGGTLTLATFVRDGRVEATVTDTGVGIPEAIRQKIFDPFFTTKGPKGTGLGLSMTYGILSRHGARIAAESGGERGTTFRLTFPAAERDEEPVPPLAASPEASMPIRCLVVDDEEVVAEVVADILTTAGHSAVVVGSGQQAVARFGAEPFDLVFTDLAMPGMTGWEVARAVKDADPAVPVVMVSGFGVEVSPEDLRAHGVDLVLSKPLRIQDVLGAVASVRSGGGDTQRGGKQR